MICLFIHFSYYYSGCFHWSFRLIQHCFSPTPLFSSCFPFFPGSWWQNGDWSSDREVLWELPASSHPLILKLPVDSLQVWQLSQQGWFQGCLRSWWDFTLIHLIVIWHNLCFVDALFMKLCLFSLIMDVLNRIIIRNYRALLCPQMW